MGGVVPRAHPLSGEHPSLSRGTPHNKMRKPKTLLLLLHRLTCHPGCVTVIADHVIKKAGGSCQLLRVFQPQTTPPAAKHQPAAAFSLHFLHHPMNCLKYSSQNP